MRTIHVLTQFVWPDAAPTSLYSEQLADELVKRGHRVRLVGTTGHYRSLERPAPLAQLIRLPVRRFPRGVLAAVFLEYAMAHRCLRSYIKRDVSAGDTVVATSAPPSTPWLLGAIRSRNARAIYRLHDYYPELIRAVWEYPAPVRRVLRARWDAAMAGWDAVLKIGANQAYHRANAQVLHDWAPFEFNADERAANPVEPKTALYAGNFGYAHDLASFLVTAKQLQAEGFRIIARGDGPGFAKLPEWIEAAPPYPDAASLRAGLLRAEVHLIAAHPAYQEALFPSKIWNSLEAGRRVVGSGFAGLMAKELSVMLATDHRANRAKAADAVERLLG